MTFTDDTVLFLPIKETGSGNMVAVILVTLAAVSLNF